MKLLLLGLGWISLTVGAWAAGTVNTLVKNNVSFTGKYFLVADVAVKPAFKKTVAPRYPEEMARFRMEGQVEIAFIVNEKGLPEEVQVASATNAAFGEAAKTAVQQWQFKPAKKDGVEVRVAVLQVMKFDQQ